MMFWFGKKSARRLAIREDAAEAASQTRSRRQGLSQVLMIAIFFFIVASLIMFYPGARVPYRVKEIAPRTLRSPVTFKMTDAEETHRARDAARSAVWPALVAEPHAFELVTSQLINLSTDAKLAQSPSQLPQEVQKRWPNLTTDALKWLRNVDSSVYLTEVRTLVAYMANVPLIDDETSQMLASRQAGGVQLMNKADPETIISSVSPERIILLGNVTPAQVTELRRVVGGIFPHVMSEVLVNYLTRFDTPTYRYSAAMTKVLEDRAAERVKARGIHVEENEALVRAGEEISQATYDKLDYAQREYDRQVREKYPWAGILTHLGQAVVVLVITVASALYVTQMHRAANTGSRGWALAILLLITLFIAKGAYAAINIYHVVYLVGIAPTLLATIIITIAFNQRLALGLSSLHAVLVTMALGQGIDFFLVLLGGIAVFSFGLKEIRTRGKLIEVGVYASATLFMAVWAIGLTHATSSAFELTSHNVESLAFITDSLSFSSLWAATAGVFVAMFALAILPFIETVFKITTAMTLLELCDANKPLLRRLAQEAPGTFNHSLIVGTLAEAAGEAVSANGLLCRVGAYYHDVGKLSKPQYFIENQTPGQNRHEKLSPAMSLLIIVGHVKDGIELAREYGLPWIVHQFIAQHHGSTLVEYFFNQARRKAEETENRGIDTPEVQESEFRYPGPKPQIRETAILMICDGVESAVRSLPEATPGRIESMVHTIIMKRLMDGQFNECDLTLRDLGKIEETLVRTLGGIYHGRVAYPKAENKAKLA